ncbi:unnamed protein product [Mycena citricolor]|uniref:Transmembrane protein n=1 Tax=Mycena citricolor TaxID=2018698 RepID=A0AAD2HSH1_9AGAR|nr:unnamed protein product [Mycena citricolor]
MATSLRRIVVDDSDARIVYGPTGWFAADAAKLNTGGNFGPVYNGTSHSTTTDGSALSFAFNGTSVSVGGTIAISTDPTTNVTSPSWKCFVDNVAIANPNPTFPFQENNWQLCDQASLSAGSHVLRIEVRTNGQPFYLDNIFYTPLAGQAYDGAVLEYTNTDSAVSYGSGWRIWGAQNVTQNTGAQVALNFYGTQASLVGYIPTELPHNATTGSYTIDGGTPVNFKLDGLGANSPTVYNVVEMSTGALAPAEHNLVVSYAGDSTKSPLAVGVFYVTHSQPPNVTSSSTPSSGVPSSSASTTPVVTKKNLAGPIAGGIIGSLVVLALVAALFFVWCRKRRHRKAEDLDRTSASPFTSVSSPAATGAISVASSQPQHAQYSYFAVPSDGHQTSAPQQQQPQPFTVYPYTHPVSSGASSSSQGAVLSHAHQPSTSHLSSVDVPSHEVAYPTPIPSHASDSSSSQGAGPGIAGKMRNERLASAALPPTAPLAPLRAGQTVARPTRHEDSGIRLGSNSDVEEMDLPPGYTRD